MVQLRFSRGIGETERERVASVELSPYAGGLDIAKGCPHRLTGGTYTLLRGGWGVQEVQRAAFVVIPPKPHAADGRVPADTRPLGVRTVSIVYFCVRWTEGQGVCTRCTQCGNSLPGSGFEGFFPEHGSGPSSDRDTLFRMGRTGGVARGNARRAVRPVHG